MRNILLTLTLLIPVALFAGNNPMTTFLATPLPEAPPAYRSSMKGKNFAGFFGGYNMYMGSMSDSLDGGMMSVGIHGRYFINHKFAVSADFAVGFGKTKIDALDKLISDNIPDTMTQFYFSEIKNRAYSIPVTFSVEYFLTRKTNPSKFKGYIGLGIGYVAIFRNAEMVYTDDFARSTDPMDVALRSAFNEISDPYNRTFGGFAISPKLGFLWTPNEYFGFTGEAKFSAIVGKEFVPGLTFNVGMVFQLSNRKN